MTEVNRRNMLGAAGAAIAFATYATATSAKQKATSTLEKLTSAFFDKSVGLKVFGTGPSNDVGPDIDSTTGRKRPKNYNGSFKPAHDFLAYMKFDGGKLKIRTAYFAANVSEDLTRVEAQFESMAHAGVWGRGALDPSESFDGFAFGNQSRLYFFIDNGPDVTFDPINLIIMSFFKAKDHLKDATTLLPSNNSFQNPEILTIGKQSVLAVENWYAYKDGKPIAIAANADLPQHERVEFSMNIHLLMNIAGANPAARIPIVIDPDGTNGMNKP